MSDGTPSELIERFSRHVIQGDESMRDALHEALIGRHPDGFGHVNVALGHITQAGEMLQQLADIQKKRIIDHYGGES